MEHNCHIIALAGNPDSGKCTLLSRLIPILPSPRLKFKKAYEYSGRHYLLIPMEAFNLPDPEPPEAVVLVCDALCLEQGLYQLKELLAVDRIKEQGLPVILCINFWDEAGKRGILIDTALLEDVLQIPVVPCCANCREQLDDVKAAIHYSLQPGHKKEFYYQCLDFSPGRLARECIAYTDAGCLKQETLIDQICACPLTVWVLLLTLLFTVFRIFF